MIRRIIPFMLLLIVGCGRAPVEDHRPILYHGPSYSYAETEVSVYNNSPVCTDELPYYHDPEECGYYTDGVCCIWIAVGREEVWCWWEGWCGWSLEEVYSYI